MPTCLYCRENRDSKDFNREHVIPEAFGLFGSETFVLHEAVCRECNSYFGNHLELKLGRDSIEGLDRYEHGVKRASDKTEFGRSALLKARVKGGFFDGAEVWWGPSAEGTELVLWPFPQIGVSDESGRHVWFRADAIPTKPELHAQGFPPCKPLTIKVFGADWAEVERELKEKGYDPSPLEVRGNSEGREMDIDIRGIIDQKLMRTIAKIAYNYLAFHYGAIAQMPQFDEIRRYIRYGDVPSRESVSLAGGEFLAGVPRDQAPVVHGVGVSWRSKHLIGQVTLFFRFHYRVVLADGGFVVSPSAVSKGHLFDPINKQVVELTSDPRRGRPIPPPPRN